MIFFFQSSGAHCEVDKNAPPDAREKNFIIRGSPEAVERAKAMIMEKLGGPSGPGGGSSYGGASANYGGSWGGQYQSAPAGGFAAPEPGMFLLAGDSCGLFRETG